MNVLAIAQSFKQYVQQILSNRKKYTQQRNADILNFISQLQISNEEQQFIDNMLNEFQGIITKYSLHLRMIRAGTRLSDFKILRFLGRGAYSLVYLVQHRNNKEYYALKRMNKDQFLSGSVGWLRAQAERSVLLAFESKYIAQLRYSFQDDKYLYFVMSYASGGDLQGLLDQCGLFPLSWVRRWFAQMVCAVCTLHGIDISDVLGIQKIITNQQHQFSNAQKNLNDNINIIQEQLSNNPDEITSDENEYLKQSHVNIESQIITSMAQLKNEINKSMVSKAKNESFDFNSSNIQTNIDTQQFITLPSNVQQCQNLINQKNESQTASILKENDFYIQQSVVSEDKNQNVYQSEESHHSTENLTKFLNIEQAFPKSQSSRFQCIHNSMNSFSSPSSLNLIDSEHSVQDQNIYDNLVLSNIDSDDQEPDITNSESPKFKKTTKNHDFCNNLQPSINKTQHITKELHKSYKQQEINNKGFAHRDLKPNNFLIDEQGKVILADFGFAQQIHRANILVSAYGIQSQLNISKIQKIDNIDANDISQTAVGTLQYMAPEIFKDGVTGKSVDFWALGCILFEMLTGSVAFPITTPEAYIKYLIETPWDLLKPQPNPEYDMLPDQAKNLIQGLLCEPQKRLCCHENERDLLQHQFFTQNCSVDQIILFQHPLLQKLKISQDSLNNEDWENIPLVPIEQFLLQIQNPWQPDQQPELITEGSEIQLEGMDSQTIESIESSTLEKTKSEKNVNMIFGQNDQSSQVLSENSGIERSYSISSYIQLEQFRKSEDQTANLAYKQREINVQQPSSQKTIIMMADYCQLDNVDTKQTKNDQITQKRNINTDSESINQIEIENNTERKKNMNITRQLSKRRLSAQNNKNSLKNEIPGMGYVCDSVSKQSQELHVKWFLKQRRHSFDIRSSIQQTLQHEKNKLLRRYTFNDKHDNPEVKKLKDFIFE